MLRRGAVAGQGAPAERGRVSSSLTDCGLPGIREIPYGVHMCHFYREREDLVEALVPYFIAGLRSGERCIWITAPPLSAAQAQLELRKAGFDADAAIAAGALTLRDFSEWYAENEALITRDLPRPAHRHPVHLPERHLRRGRDARGRGSPQLRARPPGCGLADPHHP